MTENTQTPAQITGRIPSETPGATPSATLGEDRDLWRGQPLLLSVQPQAWIYDHAVDSEPLVEFDIAPILTSADREDRESILDGLRRGDAETLDSLYEDAAERGLVKAGFGPYYVAASFDLEMLDHWVDANLDPAV